MGMSLGLGMNLGGGGCPTPFSPLNITSCKLFIDPTAPNTLNADSTTTPNYITTNGGHVGLVVQPNDTVQAQALNGLYQDTDLNRPTLNLTLNSAGLKTNGLTQFFNIFDSMPFNAVAGWTLYMAFWRADANDLYPVFGSATNDYIGPYGTTFHLKDSSANDLSSPPTVPAGYVLARAYYTGTSGTNLFLDCTGCTQSTVKDARTFSPSQVAGATGNAVVSASGTLLGIAFFNADLVTPNAAANDILVRSWIATHWSGCSL